MSLEGRPRRAHVKFLTPSFHYRRNAFEAGLQTTGYEITKRPEVNPKRGDLLVLWNRYSRDEIDAKRYEAAGGTVLIAENAWLGPEEKETHHFALCRGHHNGAGLWWIGPEPRYQIPVEPWRTDGEHLIVLPGRGMGEPGVRQPEGWAHNVAHRLAQVTSRPIVVRHHPGVRPHEEIDWNGTWAVVTWSSGAAIKALVAGIPVFYEFPKWIAAGASRFGIDDTENPYRGDAGRNNFLHRLSWAQWTADEIAEGAPFRWFQRLESSLPKSSAGG